ncbi:hypothetical protein QWT69_06205 [Sporosarcina oncorhynchi]|uniref:Uncharacterized protein n=1 Tax=Sporosarcina oncorhynchi TaxID=3056444 RepID=A0ABZ0L870_9BACL|nr:hypothetical protein [Sporosarcina sp. T2O-4]WOV88695.1 hypothetical protein QWT69_06205 [Sporosarcina sp. T2O-4]
MSEQLLTLDEMKQIDECINKGFSIHSVDENLSGMLIIFKRHEEEVRLQVLTAEARKYFAAKLQEQMQL